MRKFRSIFSFSDIKKISVFLGDYLGNLGFLLSSDDYYVFEYALRECEKRGEMNLESFLCFYDERSAQYGALSLLGGKGDFSFFTKGWPVEERTLNDIQLGLLDSYLTIFK